MKELNEHQLVDIRGGTVSSDTLYAAAIGVSIFALGALIVAATGGAGAAAVPGLVSWGLGIVGTAANASAIAVAVSD